MTTEARQTTAFLRRAEARQITIFLRQLRTVKGGWYLDGAFSTRIRRGTDEYARQCPITAVVGIDGCYISVLTEKKAKLSEDATRKIIAAADNAAYAEPTLRRRLLKAVGLLP